MAYDHPRCTFAGASCFTNHRTQHSAPGLSLQGLHAAEVGVASSYAPICQTCDPLPVTGPEDVDAKFACLTTGTPDREAAKLVDPALDQKISRKLRQLYETQGTRFAESEREFIRPLYAEQAPGPVCPTTIPSIPNTCPAQGMQRADNTRGFLAVASNRVGVNSAPARRLERNVVAGRTAFQHLCLKHTTSGPLQQLRTLRNRFAQYVSVISVRAKAPPRIAQDMMLSLRSGLIRSKLLR